MKKCILPLMISSMLLMGCQPRPVPDMNTSQKDESSSATATQTVTIPLIQAQTERVTLQKNKVCQNDNEGVDEVAYASCTKYHLQTVKTNVDWINQYFNTRLKADHSDAFDTAPAVKVTLDPEMPSTNYSTASVRYLGQYQHLATFSYFSDYFPAGAAHGMHNIDYIVFDLNTQKKLVLSQIVIASKRDQLKKELFEHNRDWLEERHIEFTDFAVSENFYFNAHGLFFVYPLYELASYAEGITELELPYWAINELILPEYLPQLPASTEEIYNDE